MPIADPRHLLRAQFDVTATIIEHDEIVARAIHLCETQHVPIVAAAVLSRKLRRRHTPSMIIAQHFDAGDA
jgi:hypothetical protein